MKNLYIYKGVHIEWETEEELVAAREKIDLADQDYLDLITKGQAKSKTKPAPDVLETTSLESKPTEELTSSDVPVPEEVTPPVTEVTDPTEKTSSTEEVVTPPKTTRTRRNR